MAPRRADDTSTLLGRLERLKARHGGAAAASKLALLRRLARRRLPSARAVSRFHEALCFLRAFPDTRELLAEVERQLEGFAGRPDLLRHRRALTNSGIAGTPIAFQFFWFTALWLARRWPRRLSIDWPGFRRKAELADLLHLLVPYGETPALDEVALPVREWIRRLKGAERDATFVIRRFQALRADSFGREAIYERLDIPIRLAPGPETPSRTRAWHDCGPVSFQARPLRQERPDLRRALARPPLGVRAVSLTEGETLIDRAREAMVTRSRDLDVFEHGDPEDVRLFDCGEGLTLACIGAVPERRLLLEAVYGFLMLKNGVPLGYVLASALFGSSEIAYNVFETFRGAESAHVYGRVLAAVRHLVGSDAFGTDPYQLGQGNHEALASGAWWFYYKLGFRPHAPDVRRVLRVELERMRQDPRHRSSPATLGRLASDYMFFFLGRPRRDVLGRVSLGNIGLAVARYTAERFGADRERATRACAREAARLLGLASLGALSPRERLWWERWGPLVLTLPDLPRYSPAERRALAQVIRAKGGRRESDFVRLANRHRRLRRSLLTLAEEMR
jgi:hypothetical protein